MTDEKSIEELLGRLKEWVSEEPHVPKDMNDKLLRRFLHSCYYDIEKAQNAIEVFSSLRATSPELVDNRDPLSSEVQTTLKGVNQGRISISGNRVVWLMQLDELGLQNFNHLQVARLFFITSDAMFLEDESLADADVVLMDAKGMSLRILMKMNFSVARKMARYQEEAMPIRLKEVHVYNSSIYMDKIFSIVKQFMKQDMTDMMPQQSRDFSPHDISSIKEWINKEAHLPQDLDDVMIKKFLHSCYGSLERTKKCIDRFCTTRSIMTEVYTKRDPCSKQLKTAFDITSVAAYEAGEMEILIHQLDDPTLENFDYYSLLKSFSLQADYWLSDREYYPQGHIIMMDIKDYTLRLLPKVNIMFFRDYLLFLLEGMPVRVKSAHIVNYPPYYEKLFALVKPVLPSHIINVINFHPNYESLHKAIGKQYLPKEYGGDAPQGMRQQHLHWVNKIQEKRDYYLNDNLWKADLKKKPKSVESAMTGSFKTLSID